MAQLREEKISVYEFPSDEVIIFQLFSFHATLKSEYKSPICNIISLGAQMILPYYEVNYWKTYLIFSQGKTDEAWMRNLVPFAVVGSNTIIEVLSISKSEWWQWLSWTSRNVNFRMQMEEKREEGVILGAQSTLRSDNIAISRHASSHPSDSIWARLLQENVLQALALFNLSYEWVPAG